MTLCLKVSLHRVTSPQAFHDIIHPKHRSRTKNPLRAPVISGALAVCSLHLGHCENPPLQPTEISQPGINGNYAWNIWHHFGLTMFNGNYIWNINIIVFWFLQPAMCRNWHDKQLGKWWNIGIYWDWTTASPFAVTMSTHLAISNLKNLGMQQLQPPVTMSDHEKSQGCTEKSLHYP